MSFDWDAYAEGARDMKHAIAKALKEHGLEPSPCSTPRETFNEAFDKAMQIAEEVTLDDQ